MNSYQKIKKQNLELKRRLRIVILQPGSAEAMQIKLAYSLEAKIENALWAGSPNSNMSNPTSLKEKIK